jgi:hypothetical protein
MTGIGLLSAAISGGTLAQAEAEGPGPVFWIVYLVLLVAVLAGSWMMYTKAGKPGWAAIIPIYNLIVLLEIVGRPIWWVILMLIPFVNLVVAIIIMLDLAKSFGKSTAFAIGLIFLGFIFIPILGFGSARYVGPAAAGA